MAGALKIITRRMLRINRKTHPAMTRRWVVCFLRFFSSMLARTRANTWAASSGGGGGGGRESDQYSDKQTQHALD